MSSRDLSLIDSKLKLAIEDSIDEFNKSSDWTVFVTDAFRTNTVQEELYSRGRTKPGKIVTSVRNGNSKHTKGMAVDVAFQKDGKLSYDDTLYEVFAPIARKHGLEWGWDLWQADKPHFQLKYGTFYTFSESAEWAKEEGLTNGADPQEPLTREQLWETLKRFHDTQLL